MTFLIPEGIVGAEGLFRGGEALEDAKVAERTVPKMEKPVEKSSTLKDLFLYKSMQQPTQVPVIINNQNIQPVAQPVAQSAPIIQPPPIETKTEADDNIVSIENNNIFKVEQAQISSEAKQIDQLQKTPPTKSTREQLNELMDVYEKNLSIFHAQLDRANGYLRTNMYQ